MTKQIEKQSAGFTLVEVVVVLAVVLLLSGIAVPLISSYVEDSRRGRAEAEVKMIAGALTNFYKDVGQFPSRDSSAKDYTLKACFTGNAIPKTDPFVKTHSWSDWARSTSTGDTPDGDTTPGATNPGTITTADCRNAESGSEDGDPAARPFQRLFTLRGTLGQVLDATMEADEDAFLYLYDEDGKLVSAADGGGANSGDARLVTPLPRSGVFTVAASFF